MMRAVKVFVSTDSVVRCNRQSRRCDQGVRGCHAKTRRVRAVVICSLWRWIILTPPLSQSRDGPISETALEGLARPWLSR